MAESSGSSLARKSAASSTVTLAPSRRIRLRQFEADRPAADHDQMVGQGAVGEDRLVGEIGHVAEAWDRRRRRPRAGRQHDALAPDAMRPTAPPIPGLGDVPYLTNETVFANRTLPGHLIVIGGGPIGLELAQAHRRLGAG